MQGPYPRAPGAGVVPAERRQRHLGAGTVEGVRVVFAHPNRRAVTLAATVGALAGQIQNVVLVLYLV
jgi:hypothetical protein